MGPTYFYLYMKDQACSKCRAPLDDSPCFARWTTRSVVRTRGWFTKQEVQEKQYVVDEAVCGGCILDRVLQ